jgi:RHS repeat-associated protein
MKLTNRAAAILSNLFSRSGNALPRPLPARSLRLLFVAAWCVLLFQTSAPAQNVQHTENKPDQALRSEARVDPSTRGMNLSLPLHAYPGRAGLNLPVGLTYSSKLWRIEFFRHDYSTNGQRTFSILNAEYAEHSVAGWTSSLDAPRVEFTGARQYYNSDGHPTCEACPEPVQGGSHYVRRIHVHLPGGATHEMIGDDAVNSYTGGQPDFTGMFHSVDGARMRYESNANSGSVLYLPDGSRYFFGAYDIGRDLSATHYVDRNGNTMAYNAAARQWTDTLGRVVTNPLPANPVAGSDTEFRYRLVGATQESVYTLRWKSLGNALTLDPATGQSPPLHHTGDSSCRRLPNSNDPYTTDIAPALFASGGVNTYVCADRNQDDSLKLFNPVVLAEVVLPTGQSYRFTYNVYGEIDHVDYPTGGYENFAYVKIPGLVYVEAPYDQSNRGVSTRRVGAGAGATESVWQYGVGSFEPPTTTTPGAHVVHVIAPDNTRAERWLHGSTDSESVLDGYDNPLAGMAFEERTYGAPDGANNRSLLRRALTQWDAPIPPGGGYPRNPRVTKQVQLLLDTTGNPRSTTTAMEYDADINVTTTRHYDYATVDPATARGGAINSMSPGALLRSVATTYFVNDASIDAAVREAYRARNLVGLPSLVQVYEGDVTGTLAAQTRMKYDETALASNPGVTSWTNVGAERGNPTTIGNWLNTGDTWLEAKIEYDGCGNAVKNIDPLGRVSLMEYSADYAYAYPTRSITPVPDPTPGAGVPSGSSAAFVSTTVYDLNAGVATSTTDANGQTTHLRYVDAQGARDPLNRVRKVELPDGGWTEYEYNSTPGNLFMLTRTPLDAARAVESVQYFDGLGRPSRSYGYDGSSAAQTWSVVNTEYDAMGRVLRASNPYFAADRTGAATPVAWTTSGYDALGRMLTLTTPDGAVVSSAYDGNSVEVTDQDGRRRRSVSDGLGRLGQVNEAPNQTDYNYLTTYAYDAQGNLRTVAQGQQTRSFVYDSLKRLTSATNPESGTVTYEYDANGNLDGKTDARGVKTDYTYDQLNRVIERSYALTGATPAFYVAAPAVNYHYDGTGMPAGTAAPAHSTGRLTAVKSSVSETLYTEFDVMGRTRQNRQVTDGQSYAMSYEYDLAGSLKRETYPSGRVVETQYDAAGRLLGVKGHAAGGGEKTYAANARYEAHGALGALKLGNNLWEHAAFNARLQPTHIGLGATSADSGVLALDYSYGTTNNNGNVRTQTITAPGLTLVQSYEYDEVNRLKSAREMSGQTETWKQTFTYLDANGGHAQFGNRRLDAAHTSTGLITENPHFDPATNRIAPQAGELYDYDAVGNLTKDKGGNSFAYDGENRQTTYNGGASSNGGATYSYDGDGRRVKKVAGVVLTVFVYDALGQLAAEYSSESAVSNGTQYLTADHLGTPRVVTRADGTVQARHDYLPFGEKLGAGVGGRTTGQGYSQLDGSRQKWAQLERDAETGLDYAQNRYYSSTMGRFTSVDPTLGSINVTNPQTLNRYTYALNNPLAYIDPDGLEALRVGKYEDLTDDQKRLFLSYVRHNYAKQIGDSDAAKFAANLWNQSAGVANGTAQGGASGLLNQSQLTTFLGVTSMLESKGVIGEVKSVTMINGDQKDDNFRIYGDLKGPDSHKAINKVFDWKISGSGHEPYVISRREQGPNGQPNGQVSMTKDRLRVDVDVDYRKLLNVKGHNTPENSDIRADNGDTSHFREHTNRYGAIRALTPVNTTFVRQKK